MTMRNTKNTFGSVSKFLHWVIALLVIVMVSAGWFMDDISNDALKLTIYNLHKLTGITILFLMLVRLAWALTNPKPVSPKGTSVVQHFVEWGGHFFLYALIIAQPITGWVGSVAAGHVPHLGQWQLNLPIMKSEALTTLCFKSHTIIAILIIVTVSLHVLAALYHHYIRKDNVLTRMMPGV
ncbi:MAG: cytochrome b [Gammaproteobacteria bacterium]|nr:cytochrome b [Gammaproteobacteria bacterium]